MNEAIIKAALDCFPLTGRPDILCKKGYESFNSSINEFLIGRTWVDLTSSDAFISSNSDLDISDIFFSLTRDGLRYFMPGFLIHFYKYGIYDGQIVFYSFIKRLQPDFEDVMEYGDPSSYFNFNSKEMSFCSKLLDGIYLKHGDIYKKFVDMGFEYEELSFFSIYRAIILYWNKI